MHPKILRERNRISLWRKKKKVTELIKSGQSVPLKKYEYPINNERYQNDGITRNFEYDGIITGTSMTENFKTTEADSIFHASFIKVPFSGGWYKEINDNLKRAYDSGKSVKYIIRCLDYSLLIVDGNGRREDIYFSFSAAGAGRVLWA